MVQYNTIFHKNGVISRARVHGRRREFFQGGGHKWIFPKVFLREAKSGEICFLPLEIKKTAFFAEIFKFLSLFPHPHACV